MGTEKFYRYLEEKTKKPIFRGFVIVFLTLIVFINAEIGRRLGTLSYPFSISSVWPATGFSLASILLVGFWTWPGVFLGNFLNSVFHFYLSSDVSTLSTLVAASTAIGSTIEALVAGYIIQKYTQGIYLSTVRNVVIFLLPGGIFSCLIACSVGTTVLYFYGSVTAENAVHSWLTYWIGDTMGVYVFTPIIIVWAIMKPKVLFSQHRIEAVLMGAGFVLVTLMTYSFREYPLAHLFLPLAFWSAYRFRLHGATLVSFFLAVVMEAFTAQGRGPYVMAFQDPLLLFTSYVEIIVMITLMVGALIDQNDAALQLLHEGGYIEKSSKEQFVSLSGGRHQILVPLDVAALALSMSQNLNIHVENHKMEVTPKQPGGTIQVQLTLPK